MCIAAGFMRQSWSLVSKICWTRKFKGLTRVCVCAFLLHFWFCFFQLPNAGKMPFSEKLGTASSRRNSKISLQGMGVGGN